MKTIDLRSDTVTLPVAAMKQAMLEAPLGDDVYEEDPSVNRLQEKAAAMLGKESALFTPSATQSNLIALLCHCQRGEEYIVGMDAHAYKYEAGGAAVLGSIQPQPILFEENGTLDLQKVIKAIKPDDVHFAKTRLLCLENTTNGKVLPMEYLYQARELVDNQQLNLHLDGARIFNAAVELDVEVKKIAAPFDSITVCLSKGLGSPAGSLLVASRALIDQAKRWRKMLGGGMRQAGILAAAGSYALDHHVQRIVDDHQNATLLAKGLAAIKSVTVHGNAQTNMVFISAENHLQLAEFLNQRGIIVSSDSVIRLVTHLDISKQDVETVIRAFEEFYSTSPA